MKASIRQKSCIAKRGCLNFGGCTVRLEFAKTSAFAQVHFCSSGLSGKSVEHRFKRQSVAEDFTRKVTYFKIDNVSLFQGINE